jgi:hypothetical protein
VNGAGGNGHGRHRDPCQLLPQQEQRHRSSSVVHRCERDFTEVGAGVSSDESGIVRRSRFSPWITRSRSSKRPKGPCGSPMRAWNRLWSSWSTRLGNRRLCERTEAKMAAVPMRDARSESGLCVAESSWRNAAWATVGCRLPPRARRVGHMPYGWGVRSVRLPEIAGDIHNAPPATAHICPSQRVALLRGWENHLIRCKVGEHIAPDFGRDLLHGRDRTAHGADSSGVLGPPALKVLLGVRHACLGLGDFAIEGWPCPRCRRMDSCVIEGQEMVSLSMI